MSQEFATRGILGLRSSAGPLEDIAVKFGDGVTALYGKNGAGKTWLLRALEGSLAGREMLDTHILLAIDGDSEIRGWLESLAYGQLTGEPQEEGIDCLSEALDRWFVRGGYHFRPGSERVLPTKGFKDELLSAGLIALVPRGAGDPRWDVWLCVPANLLEESELGVGIEQLQSQLAKTTRLLVAGTAVYEKYGEFDDGIHGELVRALLDFMPSSLESWYLKDEASMLAQAPLTSTDPDAWQDWIEQFFVMWSCGAPYRWLMHPLAGWAWDQRETAGDFTSLGDRSAETLQRMWSDGLPMPVARVATTDSIPWHFFSEDAVWSPNDATARALARTAIDKLPRDDDEVVPDFCTFTIGIFHKQWVSEVEATANSILSGLLQDAPNLRLDLREPLEWLIGPALLWTVEVNAQQRYQAPDGTWTDRVQVPVDELSTAERRWAKISIYRALDLIGTGTGEQEAEYPASLWWPPPAQRHMRAHLMILDEPEAALHRAAENHMAAGLDLLTSGGSQVIVATHSQEILNRREVTLTHVSRSSGGPTKVEQRDSLDIGKSVAELGLMPSDLIGIYRIYLLVEGEHDDIVVSTLLRDELAQARVKVVPMRGGAKLPSTVESHLLFDMTTAHVVALLDNVAAEDIEQTWQGAQERYLSSDTTDDAIDFLSSEFRSREGNEYQWISTWLARALKKGVHERLVPFGLEAPDVIDYLPVEILVPNAGKSWSELRAEHDDARSRLDKAKGLHDFKRWLAKAYGADTSPARVRVAAEAVTEVPEELRRLGYRLREISSRRM